MANSNLANAKKVKNDEFYTQYNDIQKEIEAYLEYNPDVFRDKVVYCNCDDPFESNFFRYFVLNFNKLGLKQLITTSYKPSPVANTLLDLIDYDKTLTKSKGRPKVTANKFIINEVHDIDGDGEFNLKDVAKQLKANKHNEWTPLKDDGDFRSDECIKLLKQSDIVVTNPPFSLFREYVKQLFDYNKKFVIIGNMNAITYKEIFPLIKANRLWLGATGNGSDMVFAVPNGMEIAESDRQKAARLGYVGDYTRLGNSCWFTNLDHGRRHKPLPLMTKADVIKFSTKKPFEKYDNYEAIEVSFVKNIPSDYNGVIGVPISFLDKYNPEQFELLGCNRGVDQDPNGIYGQGSYLNDKETFKRIFIRHKKNKVLEEYLDNLYNATLDKRCNDPKVKRAIIDKVNYASEVVSMSSQDLLLGLDFKPNDITIEALEAFLAELRSIFWLKDFGFTDICPLAAKNNPAPDFTAKYKNNTCAIEVFCLTQAHEQQKDSTLNCYVNFNPSFKGSKFGRDFISKAIDKKKQLDSKKAIMKILLCVVNSQPVKNLNTKTDWEKHAKLLYEKLNWGRGYYVGILTGAEVNGQLADVIYPKLSHK